MSVLPLTSRQLEILALCAQGKTREKIAEQLVISPATVRRHYQDIRARLGAKSMPHAFMLCIARGHICVDARTERAYVPRPLDPAPEVTLSVTTFATADQLIADGAVARAA